MRKCKISQLLVFRKKLYLRISSWWRRGERPSTYRYRLKDTFQLSIVKHMTRCYKWEIEHKHVQTTLYHKVAGTSHVGTSRERFEHVAKSPRCPDEDKAATTSYTDGPSQGTHCGGKSFTSHINTKHPKIFGRHFTSVKIHPTSYSIGHVSRLDFYINARNSNFYPLNMDLTVVL